MAEQPPSPPPIPPPLPPAVRQAPVPVIPYRLIRVRPDRYQQAARASWIAPIVAALLANFNAASRRPGTPATRAELLIVGVSCALLLLLGFLCACFALSGMKRRGTDRVLVPATIGLLINGLAIFGGGAFALMMLR